MSHHSRSLVACHNCRRLLVEPRDGKCPLCGFLLLIWGYSDEGPKEHRSAEVQ